MSKYFPFVPCGEILKQKGNSLKTTKLPRANVILGVKPCCVREITFRLQSHQWHKLAGNFCLQTYGWSCFPRGTMMEPGLWLAQKHKLSKSSSRPARSVNDRSWWAPISSSEAVKKKSLNTQKNHSRGAQHSQTCMFTVYFSNATVLKQDLPATTDE